MKHFLPSLIRRTSTQIFVLIISLAFATTAKSQGFIYTETFPVAFNTGFTTPIPTTAYAGSSGSWSFSSNDAATVVCNNAFFQSSPYAMKLVNYNTSGKATSTSRAVSPAYNFSNYGCSNKVDVFFKLYTYTLNSANTCYSLYVDFSADGGVTWATFFQKTAAQLITTYGSNTWNDVWLAIPVAYRTANFKVRFRGVQLAGCNYDSYVFVDDVKMYAEACPVACNSSITGLYFNKLDGGTDLPITNGATFTTAQLGSLYNLETSTTGTVGSVKYTISGPTPSTNIENTAPYNSPATGGGAWTGAAGSYSVNIKVYSGADGTGNLCNESTISFNVSNTTFNCNCPGPNLVLNPSFESGTTSWSSSGGVLSAGTGAVACGNYSGDFDITNAASNWVSQTIGTDLPAGTVINANVYAGVHNNTSYQYVAVVFFDANWTYLNSSVYVEVNKILANAPVGPQLYTINATVPAGAKYTQVVFGGNATGYVKTDQWCVTKTLPTTGSIGDRVWLDADGDGIQDASETGGITGITVQLKNSAGTVIATTTTNATGNYVFTGLSAGDYTVVFPVSISGSVVTVQNAGADDNLDSDASQSTGATGTITLAAGQNITNVDAGYCPVTLQLGNRVWYDANNNGINDSENGIANITVNLYKDNNNDNVADGAAIATLITDATGYYSFNNLGPGNYIVGAVIPSGYMSSSVNGGDPDNDINLDDNGQVANGTEVRGLTITLIAGTEPDGTNTNTNNNITYDFGMLPDCACTTAANNLLVNGNFENGTTGWSWSGGTLTTGVGYIACGAANGFNNWSSGTSKVWQDVAISAGSSVVFKGFAGTHTGGLACSPKLSLVFLNSANAVISQLDVVIDRDVDVNFGQLKEYTITGVAPAGTVKVRVQSTITCNTVKMDAFCLTAVAPNYTLGNSVWYDVNNNGIQDAGEPGIGGVVVRLYDCAGNYLNRTVTTDANGNYLFTGLPAGSYIAGIITPAGYAKGDGGVTNVGVDNQNDAATSTATEVRTTCFTTTGSTNNIDFGLKGTGSIGDRVWNDLNGNGVQDAGEPGIAGVTVQLKNAAGTVVATTTTDANGNYIFTNLAPANYFVVFPTTLTNAILTSANTGADDNIDSDASTASGETNAITLTAGQAITNVDAGYIPTNLVLGNFVWYDINNNGIQDAGEPGLSGVTVKLYRDANGDNVADGAAIATVTTNAGGTYNFNNLIPGKYIVGVTAPGGYASGATTATSASPDNDNNTDNNGVSLVITEIRSNFITLSGGGEPITDGDGNNGNLTLDFGLRGTGSIGDFVWNDINGNGIQDAGEPGIAGVTVTLRDAANNIIAVTTTDANGAYNFINLAPETYSITFSTPAGFVSSPVNQGGDDTKDSDPVGGVVSGIVLTAGQSNTTIDAGFMSNQMNLGDFVWNDYNNNGIQDAGEPGVADVIVSLYADVNGDNVADGAALATTTTNATGNYNFTGLTPGNYIVGLTITGGYTSATTTATSADPNNNNNTDNNGVNTTVAGEIRSNYITLTTGGEPTTDGDGNNGNLTMDFALRGTGSIGDFVWNDYNNNGIQDAGEPGLAGVIVVLKDANGITVATTTTNSSGGYTFTNLAPGTYSITFTTPAGFVAAPANQGGDDTKDSDPVAGVVSDIVLSAGQNNTTVDAGFVSNVLNLGNFVWYDRNNNGIQDAGEPGIAGATVYLYADANADNNADGAALATTTTNASGIYNFAGLTPGNYIAGVVIPSGYAQATTTATSSNPNNDNNTDNNGVTVAAGEVRSNFITLSTAGEPTTDGDGNNGNLTLDFGLKGTASIGDFVWNDLNNNGIQDAGEPGISGATVTITYPGGGTATATTNASGAYSFVNLAPGSYSITFTTPAGYVPSPANQGGDDTKDSDPVGGSVAGIILTAGQTNNTIDAGFVSNGLNLGNFVWNDINNNGIQDAGEPGIAGVSVMLYSDNDANNIPDGAALQTTTTDGNGIYNFGGLTPGNYIVGIIAPSGYAQGFTTLSSLSPNNDNNTDNNGITIISSTITSNFITLTTNGEPTTDGDGNNSNTTLDFALKGTGAIGDLVWKDVNNNGIQDVGEAGIAGVSVTLTYANGTVVTTTTDANGAYSFTNLAPGTYSVSFATPAGYIASPANQGADDTKDSDPVGGVVSGIVIAPNQVNNTIDAGFVFAQLNLGNFVWYDINNNGTQDAGEPGIPAATVKLFADANGDNVADGASLATTSTDANGFYNFSNLAPGNYIVGVTIPTGYAPAATTATSATPNNDNNTDNNGVVTSVAGEVRSNMIALSEAGEPTTDGDGSNGNLTLDFGLKGTASIGDFVWNDYNNNGVQDAGEPGLAGVIVTLKDAGGNVIATFTTNATGAYNFPNLAPGTYSVTFSTPAGYTPATANQGGDDTKDSDPIGGVVAGITLTAGQTNTTIDAGFVSTTLVIGNYVWNDINNNGIQQAGEQGVQGATVMLYADANADNIPDGAALATTITDANGLYLFTGRMPGNYIVGVIPPAGYDASATTATSVNPNNDNNTDNNGVNLLATEIRSNYITLTTAGEPTTDGDGNNGNLTLDFGLNGTGSIGDFVWSDNNNNGIQDAGEPGIAGVIVTLTYPGGATVSTTTAADGSYGFTNLAPGTYSVTFTTPAGGYIPSPANQGADDTKDSDPVGGVVSGIALAAGQDNITIDAGFVNNTMSLGNFVWNDINNNGIQDTGEPGIAGVSVMLYRDNDANNLPDGAAIQSTTTNANGLYAFNNLTPGNYIVGITRPDGYAQGFTTLSSLSPNNDDNTDNNGITIIGTTITSNFITLTSNGEPDVPADGNDTNGNFTLDFALKGTGSLGDQVWLDGNRNGIQDIGEVGLEGVIVTLTYPSGQVATTTTNSNGQYSFANLAPGTYNVNFATPTGYVPTFSNQGVDDTRDSDPVGGNVSVTLGVAQNNPTIDAGFYAPISIRGNVWHDVNAMDDNLVNNSGASLTPPAAPIPVGMFVYLVNQSTGLIEKVTTVSSTTGQYVFNNVSTNTVYLVYLSTEFRTVGNTPPPSTLPSGWQHTGQNLGITPGSDPVNDGRLRVPVLTSDVINANFGIRIAGGDVVIG